MIVHYPAILEKGNNNNFGVFFPDLPGCTAIGSSANEALINAGSALEDHLTLSYKNGDVVNNPSSIEDIVVDSDINVIAKTLIKTSISGRKLRVNIIMDEGLLSSIDKVSKNRSAFLSDAAYYVLKKDGHLP